MKFSEIADNQVTFTVPEDAIVGNNIHIVVEATDDGEIPLTRYQRVIVTVEDDAAAEETAQ